MLENLVTEKIIGCALNVHKALGPGLLESAYKECLYYELDKSGVPVEKEKPMPLIYQEVRMDCGYRVDLLVEHCVIVEIKAVEALNDVHMAQVMTYMKLAECRIGLLMNFNVRLLKDGIKRIIL